MGSVGAVMVHWWCSGGARSAVWLWTVVQMHVAHGRLALTVFTQRMWWRRHVVWQFSPRLHATREKQWRPQQWLRHQTQAAVPQGPQRTAAPGPARRRSARAQHAAATGSGSPAARADAGADDGRPAARADAGEGDGGADNQGAGGGGAAVKKQR